MALIAIGYGKVRVSFLKPKAASFTHRTVGDTIVAITLLVAFLCITYFEVGDGIEHAADDEHVRAAIHVVAGFLLLAVIAFTVLVVRWWHRLDRFLPPIGLTVFALFAITWATSAGDYLVGG